MRRAVASEACKLVRRRAMLLLVTSMAALPPLLAVSFVLLLRPDRLFAAPWLEPTLSSPEELQLIVFGMADLLCALLGVLSLTSEYRSGTILRTYQAFPSRYPVLVGKLVVLVALVMTASLVAVGLALGVLQVFGGGVLLPRSSGLLAVGFVVNSVLVTLLGYGFGLVLSRSLPALLTVVSLIYLAPDVVRVVATVFLPQWAGAHWYLPTEASGAALRTAIQGGAYAGLAPGTGAAVAAITTAVLLTVGLLTQRRRDLV